MADQNVRRRQLRDFEQRLQIIHQPAQGQWLRGGVAPAQPGAIVARYASEPGDLVLDGAPAQAGRRDAGLQQDSGTSLPCLIDV